MKTSFGPSRAIPTPTPFGFKELSPFKVNHSSLTRCSPYIPVAKSTKHCAIINPRGSY